MSPAKRIVRVVGVSFAPGYPQNLHQVAPLAIDASARGEALAVALRRNPDNPYDANAIEVHVPAIDAMVGHLPAGVAARLAPLMDQGARIGADVFTVAIDPTHPDRPGIEVRVWNMDEAA